jgi:hypothetical protein
MTGRPPAADPLHQRGGPNTYWTTINAEENLAGVVTPLSSSFWMRPVTVGTLGAFGTLGVLPEEAVRHSSDSDQRICTVIYGRLVANVDLLRSLADRTPGTSGDSLEQQLFSSVREGIASRASWRRYPVVAIKAPWAAATVALRLRLILAESHRWWRESIDALGNDTAATARRRLREAQDRMTAYMRPHTLGTFVTQAAFNQLEKLCHRAQLPGWSYGSPRGWAHWRSPRWSRCFGMCPAVPLTKQRFCAATVFTARERPRHRAWSGVMTPNGWPPRCDRIARCPRNGHVRRDSVSDHPGGKPDQVLRFRSISGPNQVRHRVGGLRPDSSRSAPKTETSPPATTCVTSRRRLPRAPALFRPGDHHRRAGLPRSQRGATQSGVVHRPCLDGGDLAGCAAGDRHAEHGGRRYIALGDTVCRHRRRVPQGGIRLRPVLGTGPKRLRRQDVRGGVPSDGVDHVIEAQTLDEGYYWTCFAPSQLCAGMDPNRMLTEKHWITKEIAVKYTWDGEVTYGLLEISRRLGDR